MPKLKNNRHEKFAQEIFQGKSATEACKRAGYAPKSAGADGHRLLKNANIQERVAELFKKTENAAIMSKQKLAEMFTRMLKTLHSDFLTMSADGVWFHDIGEETLHQEALKKVKTRVMTIKGSGDTVYEKQFDEIELESKVNIGQALSKLMGYDANEKVEHELAVHFDIQDEGL